MESKTTIVNDVNPFDQSPTFQSLLDGLLGEEPYQYVWLEPYSEGEEGRIVNVNMVVATESADLSSSAWAWSPVRTEPSGWSLCAR